MDIVTLASELVSYPSCSYQELPLMCHIARMLEQQGIPFVFDQYHPNSLLRIPQQLPETANIYVDIGQGHDVLVLYAHTDVVAGTPEQFRPAIKDGYLVGRGTSDMKSALAGLLLTAIKHHELIRQSGKRIIFAFIADEETSGTGAQRHVNWLRQQNLARIWVVLTEPTNDFAEINVGGKGYIFIDLAGSIADITQLLTEQLHCRRDMLTRYAAQDSRFGSPSLTLTTLKTHSTTAEVPTRFTYGRSAHASRAELGENALEAMLLASCDGLYAINTGDNSPNTVPDYCSATPISEPLTPCTATIDIRTTPEADDDDNLLGQIEAIIRRYPSCTYHIRDRGRAYVTNNADLLRLCQGTISPSPQPTIAIGGSDAGYYAQLTPYVIGGFGPGDLRCPHTADERVTISVLYETEQVFERLVMAYVAGKCTS